MPRSLGEIIPRKNATPGIGQALATGVKKAAGKVVFGGAPLPLTDRAFVDPDRTIEELSWGFPDVALWRGISAIPPVKEALQRPEMGREVVKSLIPRPFRPFIKVGDVPPEIQETLVDFGGIMLTGLGRGLLTPAVKSLSPQGVTSGATKRVGGVLQKSPRWNKFLDDFQKLVVEKTGKSVSREEIHNSFIRTIHKEFSKLPYLKRLNRMLGEAGLVKIGKYKISEQALENLKIMLDQGTAPGAAISTVSKGEKWGADVLKKAYKKYFKEDFPQEKPEKLPELIKGKMSEKKFKDAMLKAATEEELLNIADEADDWATNKLTKKRLRGFARRVLDRLKATPPDIGVEAPLSMEEVFKDAVGKGKAVDTDIYKLNMNNIGKEIPPNFDKTAIPAIEKATKNVKGDVIKNKIYNYLVYYYNKGITEGVMDTLNIYAQGKTKQVYYKIDKDGVSIKLVPKGKPGKIESAEEVRARIKKEVALKPRPLKREPPSSPKPVNTRVQRSLWALLRKKIFMGNYRKNFPMWDLVK